jgi:hypothetical protein
MPRRADDEHFRRGLSSLEEDLRDGFERLLFSWSQRRPLPFTDDQLKRFTMLKRERRREDVEHERREQLRRTNVEHERRFGDGRYDDRRTMLDGALDELNRAGGADLRAVLTSLRAARAHRAIETALGREIDERREHRKDREDLARLNKDLRQAEEFLTRAFDVAGDPAILDVLACASTLADLLEAIPPRDASKPERRSRRGRPSQPWMPAVRKALKDAGVRSEPIRADLLRAVQLIPLSAR